MSARHTAFQDSGGLLEFGAEYVVVGSGAGGATVAASLARGGATVCVVEAGAWRDPEHYPASCYGSFRDLMPAWGAQLAMGRALWPVVQGHGVGGSTVINSAIAVRTPADVLRDWQRDHGFGGDALAERLWAHQDDLEAELGVSPVPDASLGRNNELAIRGANAEGYDNHVLQRYAPGCEGSGECMQGCRRGHKRSANVTLVPEVLQHGGAVLSCAPVRRIRIRNGRAVGIEGRFRHPQTRRRGARFVVHAQRAVVVAASVTGTPTLLHASGVRHPALGHGFRAHPGTGVLGIYDEIVDMNRGATQGWASLAFRGDTGMKLESLALPPGMVAGRLKGAGHELAERLADYRHMAMWVLAVRAEATGRIRRGLGGGPVVQYTPTRSDMEQMRRGIKILARTHFAAGAREVIPNVHGLPYKITRDQLGLIDEASVDPRAYVGILSHLFGGAVMGADPRRSVCDPQGRVRGVDGLVVADAAAIPSTLGVNPQHTIMALARVRAEELLSA